LGWNGSTLFGIWQRLHMSKPVTRGTPPPRAHQDGLNPPFPAVQGMPPQLAAATTGLAQYSPGVKFFPHFPANLFISVSCRPVAPSNLLDNTRGY
jgi:hypothetical protein